MNSDHITNDNQPTNDDQIIIVYAGFWVRFIALIIDGIIFGLLFYGILYLLFPGGLWIPGFDLFLYQDGYYGYESSYGLGEFFVETILSLFLTAWCWRRFRATPGKMAFKLEVVDADSGETLTTGQSYGRFFAYFISTIPFGLGFIWVAFDKRKQGWHDKLANTVVIKKKVPVKFVSEET